MINRPTAIGFNPLSKSPKLSNAKTKIKVAIVSLKKLNKLFLIAGAVAKIPTLFPASDVLVALK